MQAVLSNLRRVVIVTALGLLAATAGCAPSATAPTGYAPYSQTDIVVGTGDEATSGKTVTMNYTGWLFDEARPDDRGAQFDSTLTPGGAPFAFTLGARQVIAGWEQGIPGMKVGGRRELVIPPSLGYGGTRQGTIPPNASLVFEVELLAVE